MDGPPSGIVLQRQNASAAVAVRIIFHYDGRCYPGYYIIY
jgi:hypothetical protein